MTNQNNKTLFLLLIITVFASYLNAQWTNLPGPPGGTVSDIKNDGAHIYATIDKGFYLLPPGSSTWQNRSDGLDGYVNGTSAFHDTIATITSTGAYYSTNNGSSWNKTHLSQGQFVRCMCRNGQRVYAGMDVYNKGYVQRSTNNGLTWIPCLSISSTVISIATLGDTVYAGTNSNGWYKSTDNGVTWTKKLAIMNESRIGAWFLDDKIKLAGTYLSVFRSTDSGETWVGTKGVDSVEIRGFVKNGSIIYAAGSDGMHARVYASIDNGLTWSLRCNEIGGIGYLSGINGIVQRDSMLFVASNSGLFASIDSGKTWNLSNVGITRSSVKSFFSVGTRLFAITYEYIMYSDDEGQTWTSSMNGLPSFLHYSVCVYKSFLFAAGGPGQLYISSDRGQTWEQKSSGLRKNVPLSIAAMGDKLIIGTKSGVMISSDSGATWIHPSPGLNISTTESNIMVIDNIIFANVDMALYRSTDGGCNWKKAYLATKYPNQSVSHIAKDGQYFYGTVPGYYGLYRSPDKGYGWFSLGLDGIDVKSVVTVGNLVIAGTFLNGVLFSSNCGETWNTLNDGLSDLSISSLGMHLNNLYASPYAYGAQILPLKLLGITDITTIPQIPSTTSLGQNYPNPFNATTIIPFSVKHREKIRIRIFDLLGKEICTLVNEEHLPGSYTVNWNAANYPSGVYLCRFETNNQRETKKILLLK